MNIVGRIPVMGVVERVVAYLRTQDIVSPPSQVEAPPAEPEKVPLMSIVHKTISMLKTSERDYPVKTKIHPAELTGAEQRICRKIEFDLNAAYLLKGLTQHPVELLEFGYADENTIPAGIKSLVQQETARQIIREYQDKFMQEDKFLYIADHAMDGDQIAIVHHCKDPYKIMEMTCSSREDCAIRTETIVAKFKDWNERFGIRVTGIGLDFCEAELVNKNIDYKTLSEEVYNFCPYLMYHGTSTVAELEEEMKRRGTICLWWN